jgi:glycopeptide antibiotics resistance protein
MLRKLLKLILVFCLVAYLLLLTRLIVFKFPHMIPTTLSYWSVDGLLRSIRWSNVIPFRTIGSALFNPQIPVELPTLLYNIIAFMPLGFLVPLIWDRAQNWRIVLGVGLIVSLTLEGVQIITLLGTGDIDDVILNVTGTLIGYAMFLIVWKISSLVAKYSVKDGKLA